MQVVPAGLVGIGHVPRSGQDPQLQFLGQIPEQKGRVLAACAQDHDVETGVGVVGGDTLQFFVRDALAGTSRLARGFGLRIALTEGAEAVLVELQAGQQIVVCHAADALLPVVRGGIRPQILSIDDDAVTDQLTELRMCRSFLGRLGSRLRSVERTNGVGDLRCQFDDRSGVAGWVA